MIGILLVKTCKEFAEVNSSSRTCINSVPLSAQDLICRIQFSRTLKSTNPAETDIIRKDRNEAEQKLSYLW